MWYDDVISNICTVVCLLYDIILRYKYKHLLQFVCVYLYSKIQAYVNMQDHWWSPAGGQPQELLWFHVDYTKFLEQERVPVQPTLDRLTTYLRHSIAVRHWRETILFPELAMALHARVGDSSPFRQLPADLLKHILDLAAWIGGASWRIKESWFYPQR